MLTWRVPTACAQHVLPGLRPGWYRVGLWLPDAGDSLRHHPAYAVRLANGDALWWTGPAKRCGANLIGGFTAASP